MIIQILSLYVATSLLEYILHRWIMHRPLIYSVFKEHAIDHHKTWFPSCEAKPVESVESRINLRFEYRTLILYILFSLPFCFIGKWYIPIVWAWLVWFLWSEIHEEMHFPKGRWFSKIFVFKFLKQWHCNHHRHQSKNFGILCIGADFMFGTNDQS